MSFHPADMICTHSGKVIYLTRKLATIAATSFKRRKVNRSHTRGKERGGRNLEAYLCSHCDGFHLGHRQGKDREQQRGRRPLWAR